MRVDEAVCAIRPGTDVVRHARMLARVHNALLSGDRPPADPRRLVARSWMRARAQGVDPDLGDPPGPLAADEVEQRRVRSPLQRVLPELRAALTVGRRGRAAHHGRHRRRRGAALAGGLHRASATAPTRWASPRAPTGRKAWSAATRSAPRSPRARPCRCSPPSTSCAPTTCWTCTACPVHDPRTRRDARRGRRQRARRDRAPHHRRARRHGREARRGEPVAAVRGQAGDVARGRRAAAVAGCPGPGSWSTTTVGSPRSPACPAWSGSRCRAPSGRSRSTASGCACPSRSPVAGCCGRAPTAALRLTLELDHRPPRAVVDGSSRWLHPLSTRHAEVLLLLANAGATGMDAGALSAGALRRPRAPGHRPGRDVPAAPLARRAAAGPALPAGPARRRRAARPRRPAPFVRGSTAPAVRALTGRDPATACNTAATLARR